MSALRSISILKLYHSINQNNIRIRNFVGK